MNVVSIGGSKTVRPGTVTVPGAPSPGERARLLMREARIAGEEQLEALGAAIQVARALSLDVAQGGDAYGVGVRALADRLAEDLLWRGRSLEVLAARGRLDVAER